ncbi:11S globulin seed storage protein 2-like isoform X1 [Silene latifolia]|uniref:11S globulin seed storage protein 2-like isoform X1 n=1 Tax=Silene latifolia TaxID=37657 RepID=UPI003D76A729
MLHICSFNLPGEGILGVSYPGCPETYQSTSRRQESGRRGEREWQSGGQSDLHQKVHRFRAGDILAIPPGAVHWSYNDGNEEIISIAVNDLNNHANQLDQNFRASFLAGGLGGRSGLRERRGEEQQFQQFQNIFSTFDSELMAEAFNVPEDLIKRMQQSQDRSLIVRAEKGQMRILSPRSLEEEEEDEERRRSKYMGLLDDVNGLEETVCTMRLRHNLDNRREADVFSRRGGRLNIVNQHKLPILRELDMSVEKGHMFPNTIYSPHWAMNSHSAVYVTQGDAQLQIVGNNGETIMDDTVKQGEMFVIPQFFTSICKAGNNGFEYVSFKTTSSPMKSPLVGYTSVFRAMPLQVISNSFRISPSQAQELKFGRQHQTFFLSPQAKSGRSS